MYEILKKTVIDLVGLRQKDVEIIVSVIQEHPQENIPNSIYEPENRNYRPRHQYLQPSDCRI